MEASSMVESLAPFFPSSPDIVRAMLKLAGTGREDVVLDLGCGDGRILFTAVREFGVKKAVGYEMRPELYREVLNDVVKMGLHGRIVLFNDDLMRADLREASIITVYLTTDGNEKLRPKLFKEAKKGTRIMSHDFTFDNWVPKAVEEANGHTLYLYTVPESYGVSNTK
jgi:hypothetical protein